MYMIDGARDERTKGEGPGSGTSDIAVLVGNVIEFEKYKFEPGVQNNESTFFKLRK